MILHALIVDDEVEVLDSFVPAFAERLAQRLQADPALQQANRDAGFPLPQGRRIDVLVTAHGYESKRAPGTTSGAGGRSSRQGHHVRLHLCHERGGAFSTSLRLLHEQFVAVVVSDLKFGDDRRASRAGRPFIEQVKKHEPEACGILYSAYPADDYPDPGRFVRKADSGARDRLVELMVQGFTDYLRSPRVGGFARRLAGRGLVYRSDVFGALLKSVFRLAQTDFGLEPESPDARDRPLPTLLMHGETGAGKTELARLLHEVSPRAEYGFMKVAATELTDDKLLRSVLFGHNGKVFTDVKARAGMVTEAGRGTVLLDDLHSLPAELSPVLHTFLDNGRYRVEGENDWQRAEAAVVCTVEGSVWDQIKKEGRLSPSFIDRVERNVLRLPPLSQRPDDVVCVADHFMAELTRGREPVLTDEAAGWLQDFPAVSGSVRRLQNFLRGLHRRYPMLEELDVRELEEYARHLELLPGPASASAAPAAPAAAPALQPDPRWAHLHRLAEAALEQELELSPDEARETWRLLLDEGLPPVWQEFVRFRGRFGNVRHDLFVELWRYYAVLACGNASQAAEQLGMGDAALRQFLASKRDNRLPPS